MIPKSRLIRVAPEFDDILEREIAKMKEELERFYGIKLTKTKATGILARKMQENGRNGFF